MVATRLLSRNLARQAISVRKPVRQFYDFRPVNIGWSSSRDRYFSVKSVQNKLTIII